MDSVLTYFQKGGPAIFPLCIAAFFLYRAITRYYLERAQLLKAAVENEDSLQIREDLLRLDRQLRFIKVMAYILPLLGLLGTVIGMVKTFTALGEVGRTMASIGTSVSSGIAEALLSTQTGLTFAVPALVLQALIQQDRNRLIAAYRARTIED